MLFAMPRIQDETVSITLEDRQAIVERDEVAILWSAHERETTDSLIRRLPR
jgi:hypothetical protein